MIAASKWLYAPELGEQTTKPEGVFSTEPVDKWLLYERAKRRLQALGLSPSDYDERLRMVAEEIGV